MTPEHVFIDRKQAKKLANWLALYKPAELGAASLAVGAVIKFASRDKEQHTRVFCAVSEIADEIGKSKRQTLEYLKEASSSAPGPLDAHPLKPLHKAGRERNNRGRTRRTHTYVLRVPQAKMLRRAPIMLPAFLLDQSWTKQITYAILLSLRQETDGAGRPYVEYSSQAYLADRAGISERSVSRALKTLKEERLIHQPDGCRRVYFLWPASEVVPEDLPNGAIRAELPPSETQTSRRPASSATGQSCKSRNGQSCRPDADNPAVALSDTYVNTDRSLLEKERESESTSFNSTGERPSEDHAEELNQEDQAKVDFVITRVARDDLFFTQLPREFAVAAVCFILAKHWNPCGVAQDWSFLRYKMMQAESKQPSPDGYLWSVLDKEMPQLRAHRSWAERHIDKIHDPPPKLCDYCHNYHPYTRPDFLGSPACIECFDRGKVEREENSRWFAAISNWMDHPVPPDRFLLEVLLEELRYDNHDRDDRRERQATIRRHLEEYGIDVPPPKQELPRRPPLGLEALIPPAPTVQSQVS